MEEINHEKEEKNSLKINQKEDSELFNERNPNNIINVRNNLSDINNNNNKKYISYTFDKTKYIKTKIFGINFYHIGNILFFGFINDNSEPLFCIDKLWYCHFIIYLIEFLIYYFANKYLYSQIELWKQYIFNILLFLFFIVYTSLILINPGIVIKSEIPSDKKNTIYCRKCHLYCLMDRGTQHCYDCNVCVQKLDHHCTVVRRCITSKNFLLFVAMIALFVLIYIFFLICLIFYLIGSFKRIKHKK